MIDSLIIVLDGPAGSGKSTVSRMLAERLGAAYLDTGAMYRSVTLRALRSGVLVTDEARLTELAQQADISFSGPATAQRVALDGADVSEDIRSPEVAANVSAVSAVPGVRRVMQGLQRRIGEGARANGGHLVAEGRDMATVVFPDAERKFFVTASPEERARRRVLDMQKLGHATDEAEVAVSIRERDRIDSSRADSPLALAEDATLIDTTGLSIEQVLESIAALCAPDA